MTGNKCYLTDFEAYDGGFVSFGDGKSSGPSAKTTAWNEFSSTMASAIICLADNQKFNILKYIFDNMVKSLEGGVKFYLYPRFLQVFLDNQVEGMARNKEMYIISSHTKNIFANMRRIEAGFSGVITPLFDTMMVQDHADMGDTPVETHQTTIFDQPSTSKPQKTQKPRRKQRMEAEVSYDESEDEDHVPTPSSDPLPSGEDSYILNELMVFCTSLQEQDGLVSQENASKQERMIKEIDQNAEIALDVETQRRTNDDEIFRADDLVGQEVVMETTIGVKDSAAPTTDVTKDEVTMAQALAALKSTKPKVIVQEQEMSTTIIAAATTVTTVVPTPRAKVELIEKKKKHFAALRAQEKRNKPPTKTQMKSQMSTNRKHMGGYKQSHLKGRSFDEIKELFDREMTKVNDIIAMDSKAQENSTKRAAEHLESDISKKQKVDENIKPVIDDAKKLKKCIEIVPDDGDGVLIEATPLSSRSPTIIDYKIHKEGKKNYFKIIRADEFSEVQKARLLVELIEKKKKHFAALRAQEKRNKPPTKTQMKSQMSTNLKNIGGYKQSHLKVRSFDEIKELFDREITKVNDIIAMDSKAQENRTKRAAEHLESDISKKQKVDENIKPVIDDAEKLKKCIEIVPDDGDEVLIEATPLSSRSPTIIDYKIHKEGNKNYFKIIRADGNSQVYQTFEKCLRTLIEKI
nr:hypothetical protein [Tanacetum cinerariifolium]